MKKLVLELGGKSPLIMLADGDAGEVVKAIAGVALHGGQSCIRLTRFVIPRPRYDEVAARAVEAFAGIAVGDPHDPDIIQGPQISARQQNRIWSIISQARAQGAELLSGGLGRPSHLDTGYFVRPNLFGDVSLDSELAQTEVFGPVAALLVYDDLDEAIHIANNSPHDLHAAVTGRPGPALSTVARRLRAGMITVNGVGPGASMPFGGWRQSGLGVDGGLLGFEEHLATSSGTPLSDW